MNDNDRELLTLMNAELDGQATPEESDRLHRAMESRPELKAEYAKLGGVVATLGQLCMEEPPASLKQDVLRAIRTQAVPKPASRGWIASLASFFGGGMSLRPAYTFAAGAALGVLAFAVLSGNLTGRMDSRSMTGAMLPLPSDSYRVLSSRDFALGQGRVRAEALSHGGLVAIRITGEAPAGTQVEAAFDPGAFSPVSWHQIPAGNEVVLGSGRLSVTMQRQGQSQYLLELARTGPSGSPFRISIHSPDGYVQGELATSVGPSGR